jgi:hypothetical protein
MFAVSKFQLDGSNLCSRQNWQNDQNWSLFCIVGLGFKYVKMFQKSCLGGIEVLAEITRDSGLTSARTLSGEH